MESYTDTVRGNIRNYLDANHMTQRDLAKKLGYYPNCVSRWLNGTRGITLRDLQRLARLGVEIPPLDVD